MIEKKIKVLKDCQLKTEYGTHFLSEGEVKIVRFRNRNRFKELVGFGFFVEADPKEEETKLIPIIPPIEIDGDDEVDIVVSNNAVGIPEKTIYKEIELSVVDEQSEAYTVDNQSAWQEGTLEFEGKALREDVEEIPIEQQDPDKSELKPGEKVEDDLGDNPVEIEKPKLLTIEDIEEDVEEDDRPGD